MTWNQKKMSSSGLTHDANNKNLRLYFSENPVGLVKTVEPRAYFSNRRFPTEIFSCGKNNFAFLKYFLFVLQECPEGVVLEEAFKDVYQKFFPHGSKYFFNTKIKN